MKACMVKRLGEIEAPHTDLLNALKILENQCANVISPHTYTLVHIK
jgi:hypothetical protein